MDCAFCSRKTTKGLLTNVNCDYIICGNCIDEIPKELVGSHEQLWKLIQMRGEKINETL